MATYEKAKSKSDGQGSKEGSVVRHLQDELAKTFGENKLSSKPATEVHFDEKEIMICKSRKELSKARKVKLRSSWQTLTGSEVKLSQFDPNFFAKSNNIQCRSPGCPQQRKRQPGVKKEDLYLCPTHRKTLEDFVAKTCKEKEVNVWQSTKSEYFEGYTSLIGTLENAFTSLTKPQAHVWPKFKSSSNVVQEVCLNMRNYLIIVNALLNPDNENVNVACGPSLGVLHQILVILRDDEAVIQRLTELVQLLRTLIEHILFTFGVIYSWIYLSLSGSPAAQLGAGIGGVCGFLGFAAGPAVGAFTTIAGATFGGLIGNGLYGIYHQDHLTDDVMFQRYQNFIQANHQAQRDPSSYQVQAMPQPQPDTAVYYLTGSATGDLLLLVVLVVGTGVPPVL